MADKEFGDLEQLREMFGFFGEEFANLDDAALEFLRDVLDSKGDNGMAEDGSKVLDSEEAQKVKEQVLKEQQERAELQQRLLRGIESGDGRRPPNKRKDREHQDNLTELCQISIKGYSERVLRLSEAFLPPPNDPFRGCMDAYNRGKMPSVGSNLDQK